MPQRIAAIDAASGTTSISSTTSGMKLGSTRGRPIPSIREPGAVTDESPEVQDCQNAEPSGSTTHTRVSSRCSRT